jgi:hypothetical protein
MKKLISFLFGCITSIILTTSCFAHGVIFETNMLDENKIRINLKWDQIGETRGIYPVYFNIEKAKIFTIGYEIRIVLKEVGENVKPIFSDISGSYAEEYIQNLHGAGIINGMPDGSFRPNDNVTRAEFMTMICRILKLDTNITESEFSDIQGHWAMGVMQAGVNKGLIKGYYDNTIKPDKFISVAESCAVIDKSFTFKTSREGYYQKLQRGKWFSISVKKIFDAGILTVDDPLYKDFDEDKPLTRADIAMMLSRASTTF